MCLALRSVSLCPAPPSLLRYPACLALHPTSPTAVSCPLLCPVVSSALPPPVRRPSCPSPCPAVRCVLHIFAPPCPAPSCPVLSDPALCHALRLCLPPRHGLCPPPRFAFLPCRPVCCTPCHRSTLFCPLFLSPALLTDYGSPGGHRQDQERPQRYLVASNKTRSDLSYGDHHQSSRRSRRPHTGNKSGVFY